jgi:hypothetical protein
MSQKPKNDATSTEKLEVVGQLTTPKWRVAPSANQYVVASRARRSRTRFYLVTISQLHTLQIVGFYELREWKDEDWIHFKVQS